MKRLGFLYCSFLLVASAIPTHATIYDLVATPVPGDASWISDFSIRFNDLNNDGKLEIDEIVSFSGLTFFPNFTPTLEYFYNQVTSVPVVLGGDPLEEMSIHSYGGSSCYVSLATEPWTFVNCNGSDPVYPAWSFSQFVWDYTLNEVGPIIYISKDGVCDGNEPCFSSVQDGVDEAEQFSFLSVTGGVYNEDVTVNKPDGLAFQGGWDSTFATRLSFTTIKSITIEDGTVTVEYLAIK